MTELFERLLQARQPVAVFNFEDPGSTRRARGPAAGARLVTSVQPTLDHAQLRAAIERACNSGEFQKAYDVFKQSFGEAHRHTDLCFFAGIALFELGKHALALQYFQSAALAANVVDWNVAYWLARTHQKLGELELAQRFAEQAYADALSSDSSTCTTSCRCAPEGRSHPAGLAPPSPLFITYS